MKTYRIRRAVVTASTNDDARQAAEAGEAEGLVIHALKQTAGRGRHGRQWESPEGNLYCSVLLRPKTEPRLFGQYSMVAALALVDTIKDFAAHATVTLKWPNDVLANGKKIGGILLEAGEGYLVIGIGVNILHHPESELYPATSLYREHIDGVRVPPASLESAYVLQKLLEHISRWQITLQRDGFTPIRMAWLQNAQKGRMTVKLPKGVVEGEFVDIDQEGHLCLRSTNGIERVTAGDVFLI